jgi:polar amino acid transport system substrate-binding protein
MIRAILATVLTGFVAAVSTGSGAAELTLAELQKQQMVRLGFANEAPFSYAATDGSLAGADYEIVSTLFAKLGVPKVEGVLTPFGSLIPGLKARRFDVIGTGLYIRPARCKEVAFSEPNYVVGDALIVTKGNPSGVMGFGDFVRKPEMKLGVVTGGTISNAVKAGVPEKEILQFGDVPTMVSALRTKRVEALIRTSVDATAIVRENGGNDLEIVTPVEQIDASGSSDLYYAGFAFASEDKALLDRFNAELKAFLGTPEHKAILDKYGIIQQSYPIAVSTAKVCAG